MKNNLIKFIFILCIISIPIGIMQTSNYSNKTSTVIKKKYPKLMVLSIEGVIQSQFSSDGFNFNENKLQKIIKTLRIAAQKKQTKAILIRINSPGGTAAASQELYDAISAARKSGIYIVTSIADIGASGAYYAASASNYIIANRGSMVGSIGVIMAGTDMTDLMKKIGIEKTVFKAGKFKDSLAYWRDLTKEESKMLQGMVDETHKQFIDDIMVYRSEKIININEVAQGQIFTGSQALKIGLIDELGDKYSALKHISKQTGIKYNPEVYEEKSVIEKLISELNLKSFSPFKVLLQNLNKGSALTL